MKTALQSRIGAKESNIRALRFFCLGEPRLGIEVLRGFHASAQFHFDKTRKDLAMERILGSAFLHNARLLLSEEQAWTRDVKRQIANLSLPGCGMHCLARHS